MSRGRKISRSSMRTSISGTSTETTILGSATPNRSRSGTATTARSGATISRPITARTRRAHRIIGTVHVEAEWDRADAGGRNALARNGCSPPRHSERDRRPRGSRQRCGGRYDRPAGRKPPRPRHPAQAPCGGLAVRGEARDSPARWTTRAGGAATRPWNATACPSICRRPGGTSTPRRIWRATFPKRRSSSTIPAFRPTAARRALPDGAAPWRRSADCPNVAVKISGLGQPGRAWTVEANGPIIRDTVSIFGADRCLFASNYPVDSLVASFDTIVEVMRAALERPFPGGPGADFSGNAIRLYRLELGSLMPASDGACSPAPQALSGSSSAARGSVPERT